ncbi:MAG TPA: hypothetical protein VLV83_05680, partial [Acidobacteriota bacterium]|nr:hypothetical protein [Acidobacteriota bacterium]
MGEKTPTPSPPPPEQRAIEAVPRGLIRNGYVLQMQGQPIAELVMSGWREKATFDVGGVPYQLCRQGAVSGDFVLESQGRMLARATKPSAFKSRFEIQLLDLGGLAFTLRKGSLTDSSFRLFRGSQQVGRITREGFLKRRTSIELPEDLPLPSRIFLFWLARLIWDREQS